MAILRLMLMMMQLIMKIVVLKFGGTSVGSTDRIKKVANIDTIAGESSVEEVKDFVRRGDRNPYRIAYDLLCDLEKRMQLMEERNKTSYHSSGGAETGVPSPTEPMPSWISGASLPDAPPGLVTPFVNCNRTVEISPQSASARSLCPPVKKTLSHFRSRWAMSVRTNLSTASSICEAVGHRLDLPVRGKPCLQQRFPKGTWHFPASSLRRA